MLEDIADPSIRPIATVTIPLLDVPDFTSVAPNAGNIDVPTPTFDFSEVDYSSTVLEQVDDMVQQMLAGGVGIPGNIWNMIWERGATQVDKSVNKAVADVNADWAGRGFDLPQGVQMSLVNELRQEGIDKKAELARDNAISYSQEEIKNLQFAVQQGIALEALRGGWYEHKLQRSFELAKYVFESSFRIFEAELSLLNAEIALYGQEAQAYKIRVEAEVAKLEKYRLDIESQQLVLSDNDNQIKLYGARIAALNTYINEYNARVQAASVEADVVRTKVQVYSEEVNAFSARISAESEKVKTYTAVVDSERVKASVYQTSVSGYAEEIKAYSAKIGASSAKSDADISIEQLKITNFDSQVKAFASDTSARATAYKARVDAYDANVRLQTAQSKDEQFKTQILVESDKNTVEFDRIKASLQVADSQNQSNAANATSNVIIDTNKSIADIMGRLAGSIYAAINVSSSESSSATKSCSVGVTAASNNTSSDSEAHIYSYDGN